MAFNSSLLSLMASSAILLQACASAPPSHLAPSQSLAQNPNYETSVNRGVPSIRGIDRTGSFLVEVLPEGRTYTGGDPKFLVGIQNYSDRTYRFSAQKVSIQVGGSDGELPKPVAALSFDQWEAHVKNEHGASDFSLGMALLGTVAGVAGGAAGGFSPSSMAATNQLFDVSDQHLAMAEAADDKARAMVDGMGEGYWLETDVRPNAEMEWGVVSFVGLPEELRTGSIVVTVEVPGETLVFPFVLGSAASTS